MNTHRHTRTNERTSTGGAIGRGSVVVGTRLLTRVRRSEQIRAVTHFAHLRVLCARFAVRRACCRAGKESVRVKRNRKTVWAHQHRLQRFRPSRQGRDKCIHHCKRICRLSIHTLCISSHPWPNKTHRVKEDKLLQIHSKPINQEKMKGEKLKTKKTSLLHKLTLLISKQETKFASALKIVNVAKTLIGFDCVK